MSTEQPWQIEFRSYLAGLSNKALFEEFVDLATEQAGHIMTPQAFWKFQVAEKVMRERLKGWFNVPRPQTIEEIKVENARERQPEQLDMFAQMEWFMRRVEPNDWQEKFGKDIL
jgi:hypothetical protein